MTFFTGGIAAGRMTTEPVVAAVPAESEATSAMNDAIIRDYILRNPQIIIEAQQLFAQQEEQRQADAARAALAQNTDALINDPAAPVLGNPQGKITFVEFFDYNCGFCRRGHEDVAAIAEQFPDVKIILRPFPILGPESAAAHQVAAAFQSLYPEKYAALHDGLLTSPGKADEASAMQLALGLGGDEAKIRAAMGEPVRNEALNRTYALAGALNIQATPTYIIGDEIISGAVGFESLAGKLKAQSVSSN
ncbi:MAG: DsbA family protein [Phyllobacteriaceae bacterium]|nr:DsbA family protein [Phyllobacteriaceae bacterium]